MTVLLTLLIVVIFANVILALISSQSKLTHHQVSRVQAQYASMAGITYALERLRIGSYTFGVHCLPPSGCLINDPTFPKTIVGSQVRVILRPLGSSGCTATPPGVQGCVSASVDYTNPNP